MQDFEAFSSPAYSSKSFGVYLHLNITTSSTFNVVISCLLLWSVVPWSQVSERSPCNLQGGNPIRRRTYLMGPYNAGPNLTPAPLTPALITPVSNCAGYEKVFISAFNGNIRQKIS